jgi:hypothetical protein
LWLVMMFASHGAYLYLPQLRKFEIALDGFRRGSILRAINWLPAAHVNGYLRRLAPVFLSVKKEVACASFAFSHAGTDPMADASSR